MIGHVVATLALTISALAFWWTLTVGHAWIQRERFVHNMMLIRDRIEMDVFTGALPDVESVQFVWAKTDFLQRFPEMASMSRVVAVMRHAPLLRREMKNPFKDVNKELADAHRKRLFGYEAEIVDQMTVQLVRGSRYWFAMPLLASLAVLGSRVKTVTEPKETVENFNRVINASSSPGPDGTPVVSKLLEPHPKPSYGLRHPRQSRQLISH